MRERHGRRQRLLGEIEQGPPKEDQFIFTQALHGSPEGFEQGSERERESFYPFDRDVTPQN